MKPTSASACFCRRSAACRAITACTASALVTSITTTDNVATASRRRWRRAASRLRSVSRSTPSSPDSSFSRASDLPSVPGRMSAAIGSVGCVPSSPSASSSKRNAGAKHSRASPAVGFAGDDQAIDAVGAPGRLKRRISPSTHGERAASGEHTTTRVSESASAASIFGLRWPALASSSRSRKIGERRSGSAPNSPWFRANASGSGNPPGCDAANAPSARPCGCS